MLLRAEEQSQLQLVEREDIDDEEDLFEAIDKRAWFVSMLTRWFSVSVVVIVSLKLIFFFFKFWASLVVL